VTGHVKSDDGKPLAGARVSLSGTSFSVKTDKKGWYTFRNVPAGKYTLTVEHSGYNGARREDVLLIKESEMTFTLTPVQYPHTISGTVRDKETGEPLEMAYVNLPGTSLAAISDSDGKFVIKDVPRGKYTLEAHYIGFKTIKFKDVIVKEDWIKPLDIEMPRVLMKYTMALEVPYGQYPKPLGGMGRILHKLKYPEQAKKEGIEGKVRLALQIDKEGRVIRHQVLQALKYCDQAAIEAVKSVEWKPALQLDKPVTTWITMEFDFPPDK